MVSPVYALESWLAGLSDNGQWVQLANTKFDGQVYGDVLSGKSEIDAVAAVSRTPCFGGVPVR